MARNARIFNFISQVKQLLGPPSVLKSSSRKSSDIMAHWGYEKPSVVPADWGTLYPIASSGKKQSPVDIKPDCAEAATYPALACNYADDDITTVENNGHSVTFAATKGTSFLTGGPLHSKYTLAQFHFHWGCNSSKGSEHTVDGKQFAAEMHLVHWNSEKYKSFADALEHEDGLSVVGAFIEEGQVENTHFVPIVNAMKTVLVKSKQSASVSGSPKNLLPCDLARYFYYGGSLTTPPLNECVQWIVLDETVKLSAAQLVEFRKLHESDEKSRCIVDNFRPVCDLCDRKIHKSFK